MAGETNNLDLSQMTDTQTSKHVSNNDGNGQLDAAITAFADVTVTDTNAATVTSATLRRAVGLNILNGSPAPSAAITVTLPAISRGIVIVRNATSYAATITIAAQPVTAPAVPAGSQLALFSDGVNVRAFNAYLASLGTMAAQNASAVAITGGTITGLGSPSASSDAATKDYVDNEVAAGGLSGLASCAYATVAVLPDTPTYANGTAGVGATLTAGANGALSIDGVAVAPGDRVLVKDQADAEENGIYTVTDEGDGSNPYVLTRATDFDTAAEMLRNSFALIEDGSTLAATSWLLQTTVATVGTDSVDFVQFAGGGGITALYNTASSGSVSVANNPATTALPNVLSVTVPASAVATVWAVSVSYNTATNCAGYTAIGILLDPGASAVRQIEQACMNVLANAGADFGFTGTATFAVTVPGDSAAHVIALTLYQQGAGSGFSCTTSYASIAAIKIA